MAPTVCRPDIPVALGNGWNGMEPSGPNGRLGAEPVSPAANKADGCPREADWRETSGADGLPGLSGCESVAEEGGSEEMGA